MADSKLTTKEQRFVDAYLGSCNGNGAQAAIAAGYARGSARQTAHKLLTKADIQQAIRSRQARRTRAAILTADRRDELLSAFAEAPRLSVRDRIKAIVELNRCSGRHSVNHQHSGKLTLEQILQQSREPGA